MLRALLLGSLLALLFARCGRDEVTKPGEGRISLSYRASTVAADTLRLWVRDESGATLVGPIATPLSGGRVELDLTVPAGEGRQIEARAEGPSVAPIGLAPRGVLARGVAKGIAVRAGQRSSATVRLSPVVPTLFAVVANPGDLSYVVRWTRVVGAERYRLWARTADGSGDLRSTADTALVVTLDAAEREALYRGRFPVVRYRVRAEWSDRASVFSDSLPVTADTFADLPHVISVSPENGATFVPDTTAPRLTFDRPMALASRASGAIRLLEQPSGIEYPFSIESADSIVVLLRPGASFDRGRAYRIEVNDGISDRLGRPLDQDASTQGLQPFASGFTAEPYNPMRVSAVDPGDGAIDVGLRPRLKLGLSRAVWPPSLGPDAITLLDSLGATVPLALSLEDDGRSVIAQPTRDLAFLMRYTLSATALLKDAERREPLDQDASTRSPDPFSSQFRVQVQPEGPFVIAVTPLDGESAAPIYEPIRVRFSVPVEAASVNGSSFNVRRLPLGANIPGTIEGSADRREFTFIPSQLERDVRYQVVVGIGVRDDEGHPLDQDRALSGYQPFASSFRVEKNPQVVSVDPPNDRLRVPIETAVRVRFTLPILPASINDTTLVLEKAGIAVDALRTVSADSLSALLTPLAPLEHYRVYNLHVRNGVRTKRGSRLDQDLTTSGHQGWDSRFTTLPESLPPRVVSATPAGGDTLVGPRPTIEVHFTRPVRPVSINADNFFLKLLPSGSDVPGVRTVALDSLSATFTPDRDLEPRSDYEFRVSNWVVDRFDTRLDQDPVTPGRQEYSARWRTDREHVAPTVLGVSPLDGETDADRRATVEVLFSEPMAEAPLVAGAFHLTRDGGAVAGAATIVDSGRRLRFRPELPLFADRVYQVEVDTTALDLSGNALDQDPAPGLRAPFVSSFKTAPDREGPRITRSVPRADSSGVDVDVRPLLVTSEPLSHASISTAAFALVDSLLRDLPLAGLEVVGDTAITITPAESLAWNSRFELRALSSLVDTLGNPLDQDSTQAGAQPFVLSFRTRHETIGPRVSNLAIEGGEPVALVPTFTFRLSEAIDAASVVDSVVRIFDGDVALPTDVTQLADDSLRAVALDSLAYDHAYEVRLSGVRDLRGNLFDQVRGTAAHEPFTHAFRTRADTDPPRVLTVAPADSAERVDPAIAIHVVLSEAIDSTSANASNLVLLAQPGDQLIDGVVTRSANGRELIHHPASPLTEGAEYELRATSFLRDLAGNGLDQDPGTPEADEFVSRFFVGRSPVAALPAGLCDPPDSSFVTFDAGASNDPDEGGGLSRVVWDWGDGVRDTLSAPAGLVASHRYACLDRNGCDGLDNDGDGSSDEEGPNGCDESYKIVLTVEDVDGLTATDTTGVSFCAFLALGSSPADGSTDVDSSLAAIQVTLSRAVDPASVADSTFAVTPAGGPAIAGTLVLEADTRTITWTPSSSLRAATVYEVRLTGGIRAASGRRLDQDPCAPGPESYGFSFTTAARRSHSQDGRRLRR